MKLARRKARKYFSTKELCFAAIFWLLSFTVWACSKEPSQLLRLATFNVYLNRNAAGKLLTDLSSGDNLQIAHVAEILQRVRPDIVLLQEFDYVADGSAVNAFKENYLQVAHNGADPIDYPYFYLAESNTGIPSGFDLDNNGAIGGAGDAYGFGAFPGQYGMVLLSRHPIVVERVRTFQHFLWKDMPGAMLPVQTEAQTEAQTETQEKIQEKSKKYWYSDAELEVLRLSSKSHWDIPINVDGKILHILASHPTPPVFDGDEDRNGRRNHDEIRFWRDYCDPTLAGYIYDDNARFGGLAGGERFVIMGDLNASSDEGDATGDPISMLTQSNFINGEPLPASMGGAEHAPDNPYSASHTADWKMRADYVLPSVAGIKVLATAVFWPEIKNKLHYLVENEIRKSPPASSDHRLVYLDVKLTGNSPGDGAWHTPMKK